MATPHTTPSRGQQECQGGKGHDWRPVHPPIGYVSDYWLTVFERCTDCESDRVKHMDEDGYQHKPQYRRPEDWVSYPKGEAPNANERRLDYYGRLPAALVARKPQGKARRR
jgi:hypothetical protein